MSKSRQASGTAAPARAWPVEHHVELVRRLSAAGRRVVVTGGPDEARLTGEVSGPAGARVHDLGAVHYPELCTKDVREWPALLASAVWA